VFFFVLNDHKKLISVGCHPLEGVRVVRRRQLKGHHSPEAVTKKEKEKKVVSFFCKVTPSIAARGDTNPSDVTVPPPGGIMFYGRTSVC